MNVDSDASVKPDLKADLSRFPWPFKTSSVDEVFCSHFLEHLDSPVKAIEEIHRILKPSGVLRIVAPYFASVGAYYNLLHRNFWSYRTMDFFDEKKKYRTYSRKAKFTVKRTSLVFPKIYRFIGISMLANQLPVIYEDFFAWVFPAREVHFELTALKSAKRKKKRK